MNETRPTYILSNLTGNWAHFRPEDPNAPGYPYHLEEPFAPGLPHMKIGNAPVLKVGFDGQFTRHPISISQGRDFAKDRNGNTALWLESKTGVPIRRMLAGEAAPTVKIHAGETLTSFIQKVRAAGGDVWLNEDVRKVLQDDADRFEELARSMPSKLLSKRLTVSELQEMVSNLESLTGISQYQTKTDHSDDVSSR
jgi:hypothetical protein